MALRFPLAAVAVLVASAVAGLMAQDRLPRMPGYAQYQRMAPLLTGSWRSGAIVPRWAADSRAFTYSLRGRTYRFDVEALRSVDTSAAGSVPSSTVAPPARSGGPRVTAQAGGGRGVEQAQREMPDAPVNGCPTGAIARGRQA